MINILISILCIIGGIILVVFTDRVIEYQIRSNMSKRIETLTTAIYILSMAILFTTGIVLGVLIFAGALLW